MIKISVVMPLYNGRVYLRECIESIQKQTFTDWEFIIVNELTSDDGSVEIIEEYSQVDKRIKLIQNTERLGLAASLNEGIRAAKGEYIARVDVDDPSYPSRFEKQVKFLDENPDIVLCGSKQRSITTSNSYIQDVPCEPEELKAGLLFGCEISHCSVMFRKNEFTNNNWWYDATFLGEDYELWTRILKDKNIKVANICEALVDHRWGFGNISIEKGENLRQEVRELSARYLKYIGVEVPREDMMLLSGWRNKPTDYASTCIGDFLYKGYQLLERIKDQNNKVHFFDKKALEKILEKRWDWICETCKIKFSQDRKRFSRKVVKPAISILLPISDEVFYLRRCIDRILMQNFEEFELLIIYDESIGKGLIEIVKVYERQDTRIKVIKSEKIINTAKALNIGIQTAIGGYITFITPYDIIDERKFIKQIDYLEKNSKISACCSGSENLSSHEIYIPSTNSRYLKAQILFGDTFKVSTLLIKVEDIFKHKLFFNEESDDLDFDFLSRLSENVEISGLGEVLCGYYDALKYNANLNTKWKIFMRSLERNLNLILKESDVMLLMRYGFLNYSNTGKKTEEYMKCLRSVLCEIYYKNIECNYYNNRFLLRVLDFQWRKEQDSFDRGSLRNIYCLEQIFTNECKSNFLKKCLYILTDDRSAKSKVKYITKGAVKKIFSPLYIRYKWNVIDMICNHVDNITWNRYQLIENKINTLQQDIAELKSYNNEINYLFRKSIWHSHTKIRLVFLFQIPSFWSSWESFYYECIEDDRFDVKFVLLDETNIEKSQMKGAEEFLQREKIEYILFEDFNLEEYAPHIMVYQTPYDVWHRKYHTWSQSIRRKGIRIVYIPYGIEIADTNEAQLNHFEEHVILNCWRLYTFSPKMKGDYNIYCKNKDAVRALGHPKFDSYFNKSIISDRNVIELIGNRKVFLWKVHFPKFVMIDGESVEVTPKTSEYQKFVKYIKTRPDLFFVFMPHPKFLDGYGTNMHALAARKIILELSELENVYIDQSDDYRKSLALADYIMVDRSAIMVEAGAFDVPVLYISNSDFQEPFTSAIDPLVKSYYQGDSCRDMVRFVEMCVEGSDPKLEVRKQAFKTCIPYYDGKCGLRIKEDIVNSLKLEANRIEINRSESNKEVDNQIQVISEQYTILEKGKNNL